MQLILILFLYLIPVLKSYPGHIIFPSSNTYAVYKNPTIGNPVSNLSDATLIIYQDKKNNYWYGSNGQGVYKYDGKTLVQFTMNDGLISNQIWGIQEDKSGHIYFDTQEGISKFDGLAFISLKEDQHSSKEWKSYPTDLWFKGNWNVNGPYRYDGKTLHHLEFPKNKLEAEYYKQFPNAPWSPYGIYTIYKDNKANIWFGTSNFGIYRYNPMTKSLSWMYEEHLSLVEGGGSFGIRSIYEDKRGRFWICNTLNRYLIYPDDSAGKELHLIKYKKEKGIEQIKTQGGKDILYYMSIIEDNNQVLWMATYNQGVWRYDPHHPKGKNENITHYTVKDGSKEVKLFSIYKDRQGSLWLGTHDAGAYKFSGKEFEKFKP